MERNDGKVIEVKFIYGHRQVADRQRSGSDFSYILLRILCSKLADLLFAAFL